MEKLFNNMASEELEVFMAASELNRMGYRKISNKYKLVARIDRDDWMDILAKQLNCCRADFYKLDGSGISNTWKDHYVRVYSEDKLTVSQEVYSKMERYW